jgi:hypothetical protein
MIILRCIVRKYYLIVFSGLKWIGIGCSGYGCFEHGDEHSGFKKGGFFFTMWVLKLITQIFLKNMDYASLHCSLSSNHLLISVLMD